MKEGWIREKLGNCIRLKSGDNLTAKNIINGDYPVFGGNGVVGYHNQSNLTGTNVIIGRVGALCGNARFIEEDIWLTDNGFRISDTYYKFDFEFLAYMLNFVNLRNHARQAAQPVISNSSIKNVDLQFPNSIEEQKEIVEIIKRNFSAIDQAKANLQKNIENAKELFQSKLNKIFTQKGEGWSESSLDEVSEIVNGYAFKSGDFSSESGTRSIKITNVGVQEFVEEKNNFLPTQFSEKYAEVQVEEDNLVIALTRTIIANGLKVAKVPRSYKGALLNQRVAAIKPVKDKLNSEFLYFYLCSKKINDYVVDNVNTLMQPNLSIKHLKKMPVPICSLEDQKEAIKIIMTLNDSTRILNGKYLSRLNLLDELKKSLLQKAFSGELTRKDLKEAAV